MKNLTIITLMVLVAFPFTGVQAEEREQERERIVQPAPTKQNIIRERIEKQRTNYLQNLQEARDIAKKYRESENEDERNNLREEARNGFMVRLTGAIEQLANMQDRVENRLKAAKENGYDVEESTKLLIQSQEQLQTVLDLQEKMKVVLEESSEENSKEIKDQAKEIFDEMKTSFKDSRMSLLDSIKLLKNVVQNTDDVDDSGEEDKEEVIESENEEESLEVEIENEENDN